MSKKQAYLTGHNYIRVKIFKMSKELLKMYVSTKMTVSKEVIMILLLLI